MTRLFNWLSQIVVLTRFSLQTAPERKGAAAVAVCGIAGVVAVLIGVLSIAHGFRQALTVSGSPANAIVLRSGGDSEMTSVLYNDEARVVGDSPALLRTAEGPAASAELFVIIDLPKRSTGTDANVPLRGVGPAACQIRGNLKIEQGRRFESGRNEVMVGRGAAREFAGLNLGESLKVGGEQWKIVGVFSAGGGIGESEIWADAKVLQSAYRRGTSFQSVYVKLTSPAAFQGFKDALTTDPRLNVKVVRETEYYAEQSQMLFDLITTLGTFVAVLMGIGAVFGALNTMYSAVAARTREIATLRALGFPGGPVVISVLLESLALAFVGGLLGGGLAYAMFDGYQTATINWKSFSQVAFAFAVTPSLLVQGAVYATVIGFIGGLFPAIRAARLPIAKALREL